jgi:GAG-pre-integrase domain
MWTIPGSKEYISFHTEAKENGLLDMCFATEIEDDDNEVNEVAYEEVGNTMTVDIQGNVIDNDDTNKITPSEELLIWHNKLTHMPMRRIQRLAQRGILPERLSKCNVPLCPACLYGKMTRRPWKTSKSYQHITPSNIKPGQIVSVDQIQSNVPEFIGQMKGTPTRHRYTIATVFVDHYSDLHSSFCNEIQVQRRL